LSDQTANSDLARKYDTVAYAAQSNALSHPRHLATVATLFGMTPAPIATARVLEVGCNNGANLLPMAAALPEARFVGCDLSHHAIAEARQGAAELGLANVTLQERDLATLAGEPDEYDYMIAHGVYSWVPPHVRDALFALAARRLSRHGVLFVSYNVYPGCHVRQAAWEMLHYHVDAIQDPRAKLGAARALAMVLAEPGVTQTDSDALVRQELRRLSRQTDSALFHDDLAVPNDPVYFHAFAAHLARHGLAFVAEAKPSMMTAAGLAPAVHELVSGKDRVEREQYLDFARMRRFRQSLARRADAPVADGAPAARVAVMHVAAAMSLVRAHAEGKAIAGADAQDHDVRAVRRLLQWLVSVAPRIVPVAEAVAWQRTHAREDIGVARPVADLLVDAFFAGSVDLYVQPPPLAASASERPRASPVVLWQAARQPAVVNLRHETLRIDDPYALQLLGLLDGTRTRAELAAAMTTGPPASGGADATIAAWLARFALHGLLVA